MTASARPPGAALGIVEGLLWALRRAGLPVSPAQAIMAAEAAREVGLLSRGDLREALAAVVAHSREERARFDEAFEGFFARGAGGGSGAGQGDLWARLAARGFSEEELEVLRGFLDRAAPDRPPGAGSLAELSGGGAEFEHLLQVAGFRRSLEGLQMELQVGAFQQRALDRLGIPQAYEVLRVLRGALVQALGARGGALAEALRTELAAAGDRVRTRVRAALLERQRARRPAAENDARSTPFSLLAPAEAAEVRAALRHFAARLEGAMGVRLRRASRGRIDPHRTLRRAMATAGVPFALRRRRRTPERPRLLLLCDVSDSVRGAAGFMLELVQAAHRLFAGTRSFVFVSELGETTALFARVRPEEAVAQALGSVVPMHANSNYGRVLRAFEREQLKSIDRRTTVVILGDGRTNYLDAAPEVLGRVRAQARALYWFSTEGRDGWASGDSAMLRYAPQCTRVLDVTCARELEEATRLLAFGRRPAR